MDFDPQKDPIAIAIPAFRLPRGTDGPLSRYQEPYIVSLAIDESGIVAPEPVLHLNSLYFPKVKRWTWVNFGGQGRLVYGPRNPGSFVCYSVLFMENDSEVRQLGQTVEIILKSPEARGILDTFATVAESTYQVASLVLSQLTGLIAGLLQQNQDDELGRFEGTFFRDFQPPYNTGDQFTHENDFITCPVRVIALPTGQAANLSVLAAQFPGTLPRSV
jgi:hypothetical protein